MKETLFLNDTYEFYHEIGKGCGSRVFLAYHKRLQKYVVFKQIQGSRKALADLRQEADILKSLRSRYLPPVLDLLESDGEVYTVIDYIAGSNFSQLLANGTVFTDRQVLQWAKELTEAVLYLHGQEPPILHTDIKPANIILTEEGSICLIDFNISARSLEGYAAARGYSSGFSPPEQYPANDCGYPSSAPTVMLPYGRVDIRSDIYSIGATLYAISAGHPPVVTEGLDVMVSALPVSDGMKHIIAKAMDPEPSKRYQSAADLKQALDQIHKLDQRYRSFVRKQEITYFSIAVLMGLSVFLTAFGIKTIRQEKWLVYAGYIRELERMIGERDYDQAELIYEKAEALQLRDLAVYLKLGQIFYDQGEFAQGIRLLEDQVLPNQALMKLSGVDQVFYLLAACYFAMTDYPNSAMYSEAAISSNPDQPEYYRDYIIALIRSGHPEQASQVLEAAIRAGIAGDDRLMISGEISFAAGNYKDAAQAFESCLETPDEYMRYRSFMKLAESYRELGDSESELAVLSHAAELLAIEYRALIMRQLAQSYIDWGNTYKEPQLLMNAAEILEQMEGYGWGTYQSSDTLAILYHQAGRFEDAAAKLEQMKETYGRDYRIYKRLAFLEADLQSGKDRESREYMKFYQYYEMAVEFYQVQPPGEQSTDGEMQVLEQVFQGLKDAGW